MLASRICVLTLVAVVAMPHGGVASQSSSVQDTQAARRVREWLTAVEEHHPGRVDDALMRIRTWTDDRLRVLEDDLGRLLRSRQPPAEASFLKLDIPETRERILRRGAILHADLAMVTSPSTSLQGLRRSDARSRSLGGVQVDDGRGSGLTAPALHWLLGRMLVEALAGANRAADEFVDLWFRATTASMLASADYASVEPHLIHAQRLVPGRAHIWISTGVMHAYFATPAVQDTVEALKLPEGYLVRVRDERRELDLAEEAFRRAIGLERDNAEARLRLGRVLAQRQRHRDALTELRAASLAAGDRVQQYYVYLFSGHAEGELGHDERAREAFTRAAALYPEAQTPMVALSELAVRRGDRSAALAALHRLQTAADRSASPDPWWTYDLSYARDAATLVAALRNSVDPERR